MNEDVKPFVGIQKCSNKKKMLQAEAVTMNDMFCCGYYFLYDDSEV
jgi:hypothetical protein